MTKLKALIIAILGEIAKASDFFTFSATLK